MGRHSFKFGSAPAFARRAVDVLLNRDAAPKEALAKRDGCTAASFYKAPTAGTKVDLDNAFTIQWDNSCLDRPGSVDITMLAPNLPTNHTLIHHWKSVDFSKGQLQVQITPQSSWFNGSTPVNLQLSIVPTSDDNTPSFLTSAQQFPVGPTFKGTHNASAPSILTGNSSNDITTIVDNFDKGGLKKGQVAAAVLMPILFVAACLAGYVFWSRKKEAARRREYRENLDQRMSIAPGADWAPISAAGAAAAIRHSMAISTVDRNTKASSFFGRQSSVYQVDPPQEMRQRGKSSDQSRTSRVSFAESTLPSKRGDVPAVPSIPAAYRKSAYTVDEKDYDEKENDTLSPTQRQGAFALDEDSIRDRLSGGSANEKGRMSVGDPLGHDIDTLPALAMMRANETGADSAAPSAPAAVMTRESTAGDYRTYSIGAYSGNTDSIITGESSQPSYFNPPSNTTDPDEALRQYSARTPQMVPVTTTASPFSGFAAGPGLAAAAGFDMSPDAIFRAYAATRPAAPPAVMVNNTGNAGGTTMRTLYGPTMTQGLGLRPRADTMNSAIGNNNPYRDSMAPTHMSDDVGKAQ